MITRSTLLAVALMLALSAAAAGEPSWNAPVQLSSGDRALGPELALNAGGEALVVWDQEVGAVCSSQPAALECIHIVTAAARPRGSATWQAPIEISRPGVDSRPTAAIGGSGDAAIMWVHDIGRDRVVQATYRKGPIGHLARAERSLGAQAGDQGARGRSRRCGQCGRGLVGASRGDLRGEGRRALCDERSVGSSFDAVEQSVQRVGGAEPRGRRERRGDRRVGRGQLARPRLTRGREHRSLGASHRRLEIVVAGRRDAGRRAERSRRRRGRVGPTRGGGKSPTRPGRLSTKRGELGAAAQSATGLRRCSEQPAIALDRAGNAVVIWLESGAVETAARAVGTGLWDGQRVVAYPNERAEDARLAIDSAGNAVAVWRNDEIGSVRSALKPGASGTWQLPATISPTGATPRIALDASGSGLAVWNESIAERVVVDGRRLDGTGPVLQLLRAPRRMTLHSRGAFSVKPVPWATPLAGLPRWTFGDGGSAIGVRTTHAFAKFGRFTVSVTQRDAAGGSATRTRTVVVGAPRLVSKPSIAGNVRFGATLTCLPGTWAGARPLRFAYQWLRDTHVIPGATASRYRIRVHDLQESLGCRIRATNALGATEASARPVFVAVGG